MVDEPEEVVEREAPPNYDAEKVDLLLDIAVKLANFPNLVCIREAVSMELGQIEADVKDQLYPPEPVEEPVEAEPIEEPA